MKGKMHLFYWRNTNTPVLGQYYLNKLLMSRRTRTKIPISPDVSKPKRVSNTRVAQKERKIKRDITIKDLGHFQNWKKAIKFKSEPQIQTDPKSPWVKGTIENEVETRSYEVNTDTNTVRQHRRHIIPTEKGHQYW